MNDKMTDDMHDEILNVGRYIRQAQKINREATKNAYKFSSKEAQRAYIEGFIYGANFVASEFNKTFEREEIK